MILTTNKKDFVLPEYVSEKANSEIPSNSFGTPVYDNLYFNINGYFNEENTYVNEVLQLHVNSVLLVVSQTKNIVMTAIQGRSGTIKEYVSDGDYSISGTGTITNSNNTLPLDDLTTLNRIFKVPESIPVISQFLNEIFDINNIVIESYNFSQKRGFRNEIAFSFSAYSDVPPEINEFD